MPTAALTIDGLKRDEIKSVYDSVVNKDGKTDIEVIVHKLLETLGILSVTGDILRVTEFKKKNNDESKVCINVLFKSSEVRDYVLEKRRLVKQLSCKDVFQGLDSTDTLFVNELLNHYTYKLLCDAKRIKKNSNWNGYIWTRSGRILARHMDRDETFVISTPDDLALLF